MYSLKAAIDIEPKETSQLLFRYGLENDSSLEIIYLVEEELLSINRESLGYPITGAEVPILNKRSLSLPLKDGKLKLELFGDRSSLEIFTHDGQVLTTTFFEEQEVNQFQISTNLVAKVNELVTYNILID